MALIIPAKVSGRTAAVKRRALERLRPPPKLTISKWAETHRILTRKDSARPGRWRSEPHQPEIMDAAWRPDCWKVVIMAASQLPGKSQTINNILGYFIDQDPSNIMVVLPTVADAEKWSKGRFDPLVEGTPRLRGKVPPRKMRSGDNTILHRQFPGGQMFIVGSNAASGLAAQSVRVLIGDEVDKFETSTSDRAGDPLEQAEQRTETYWNRKVILASSPSKPAGMSRIEAAYTESNRGEWQVRCPFKECGHYFHVEFEHVHWDKDPARTDKAKHLTETAGVVCPGCGVKWNETERQAAIEGGRWWFERPFDGIAGFRIAAFGCKRASIPRLAARWIRSTGDAQREKAFVNLVCARTWKETGEAPEWRRLYERRENYRIGTAPIGVLFLTAGVDVQKNRIEVEIVGWSADRQSWSIDYHVIDGDAETQAPWDRLDELLARDWPHESGARLPIRVMCVDVGYATTAGIRWARNHPKPAVGPAGASARQPRTVVPVVGRDRYTGIITGWSNQESTRRRHRMRIATVGGPVAKSELYRQLRLDSPTDAERAEGKGFPPGYCHFPEYGEEFFKQLTSERIVTHMHHGFPKEVWEKDPGVRNEALDCRVYARAAAAIFGMDRFQGAKWAELKAAVVGGTTEDSGSGNEVPDALPDKGPKQSAGPAPSPRGMGGWLDRGRGGWLRR